MSEMDKKAMVQQYRERKRVGGICAILNTVDQKRFVFYESDLDAGRNRFEFSQKTNSCVSMKLQRDWQKHGGMKFEFEVLEVLEKAEDQTVEAFTEDLKALEVLVKEKYEKSTLY